MKFCSTALFTENIDDMKEFYTKVIELDVMMDNGIHVAFLSGLSIWDRKSALEVIFESQHERPKGHNMELYFDTDDINSEYKRIKSYDVEILNPLKEQPWGQITFRVYDPDGNIVEVGEKIDETFIRLLKEGNSLEDVSRKTHTTADDIKNIVKDRFDFS